MKKSLLLLAVLLAAAWPAQAGIFVGTTASNELVTFDSLNPSNYLSSVAITGLVASDGLTADPNATLVNIVYNPADNFHYGLDSNANFYRVGLDGVVTLRSSSFTPTGFAGGLAYDPFIGKFRFANDAAENVTIGTDGTATPGSTLKYAPEDVNAAFTPIVFALGIDPAFGTAYFVDAERGILATSVDPAAGELFTVGSLGASFTAFGGIVVDEQDGTIYASLSTDSLNSSLYTLNASTGEATLVGAFNGGVNSIAAVPEPSTVALFGISAGAALLLFRRRRMLS